MLNCWFAKVFQGRDIFNGIENRSVQAHTSTEQGGTLDPRNIASSNCCHGGSDGGSLVCRRPLSYNHRLSLRYS